MMVLDTTLDTAVNVSASTINGSVGVVLATNGKMYSIPSSPNLVGVIGDEIPADKNLTLSRVRNKL